jgi:hypothetical protein
VRTGPNMRVQRTRSSPSTPHSPLTRKPLGGQRRGRALQSAIWACLVAALASCSSTTPTPATKSRAVVSVASIEPAPLSEVNGQTTLRAVVSYRIEDFHPAPVQYYLSIQFRQTEETEGDKFKSFNHYASFAQETRLPTAAGSVSVTYAVSHVWDNAKLRKPLRVYFFLVQRKGAHDWWEIGHTGPVEYAGH